MKQFTDVFSCEYSDLKTYDKKIIQHKIPLEKDTIPFKQKLRPINPMLLPLIEKEIKKLLAAKIIVPLRYSKWVANLVVVRKKSGKIRLCVDFINLNKCSKKDNYPLPKMEHLLQKVSGAKVMSFVDGFSGFNQIIVHPNDQEKTAFTTPWGTFIYTKMPFALMNVGATFQRAMDIAFLGEKDKFVLIYLDDITIYSSSHQDHLQHLKKVFLKCRRCLNRPRKSKSNTDPVCSEIKEGYPVLSRKNKLCKKVHTKFYRADTLAVVLLQADEEGSENLVAFFSKTLRDAELRYDIIEKQAYSLIKSLKAFRVYILHSKVIAYVPSAPIKVVLTQPDVDGRRAKWIAKLIEFNIELKPTKLVTGQGLSRLLAEENCRSLDIDFISTDARNGQEEEEVSESKRKQSVAENIASCDWYFVIIKFLLKLEIPPSFTQSRARTIKLRAAKYCINRNLFYWRDPSGVLLTCLDKKHSMDVMQQLHSSMCGGHHYWKTTAHKTLRAGYYWPSLFSDAFSFVKSCDRCQRLEGRQQLKSFPLKPIHAKRPFQQWGLDFIGEINPNSSGQHRWILVATDYFTKWIGAIPTRKANHNVVIKFLTENIFTRFGCPHNLVTDNAVAFEAKDLVDNWDLKLKYALWADKVTIKRSTGNSPFKLVYGIEAVFPIQLTLPVAKFLQTEQNEEEDMAKRITDLPEVHQIREQLVEKAATHQKKIKEAFDKRTKADNFQVGDLVLKWDALKEKKGNHGKFDAF
eukprot:PITA_21259